MKHIRGEPRQNMLAHWEELKSNWNPQEPYQNMTVVQLRELARANKVRLPYGVNKAQMVETLFRQLRSGTEAEEAPAESRKSGCTSPSRSGFMTRNTARATRSCRRCSRRGCWRADAACWRYSPAATVFCGRRTERRDRTISMCRLHRFADSDCAAAMKSSERRAPSAWATATTR